MDLNLQGKRVVITGASKGIGLAAAHTFAREGATVFAAARSAVEPSELITPVALDLTDPDAARSLTDTVREIDILVNNLGGVVPGSMTASGFLDLTDEVWQATYELNFFATVRVTRALLPGLLARRGVGDQRVVDRCQGSLPAGGLRYNQGRLEQSDQGARRGIR